MSLRDWLAEGRLKSHRPSRQEIHELLSVADRDLKDCRTPGLSTDTRLSLAYKTALQAATAALAAAGFRTTTGSHHYWTIQSLAHTVEADAALVDELHRFRRKRNIAQYQVAGATSEAEAQRIRELAERLRKDVVAWLRDKHPRLLEK